LLVQEETDNPLLVWAEKSYNNINQMESFTVALTEQLNASSDQLYVSLEATNPWFQCRETPTSDTISQLLREGECYIKWVIYFLWTALSK